MQVAGPHQAQNARVDQRVIGDDIGARQRVKRQGGEEPGVSGPGPNEPYAARFKLRQTEKGAVDHSEDRFRKKAATPRPCVRADLAVGESADQR